MRPNFSVVIPCFNSGIYITETVRTVIDQKLHNIEIIVVDDCSTDKITLEVLKSIESSNDNILVLYNEKNMGVSAVRNRGIKASSSKYILCLDSDDLIESEYLLKAYNIFEKNSDIDIVSSWVKSFGVSNDTWKPRLPILTENVLISSPIHTASCFKKSVWSESIIGYDESLKGYEDWDFWLRLYIKNCKFYIIEDILFKYRKRENSKYITDSKDVIEIHKHIINNHYEFYSRNINLVLPQMRSMINIYINNENSYKQEISSLKNHINKLEKNKQCFLYELIYKYLKNLKKILRALKKKS